jgi:hypothetical protein
MKHKMTLAEIRQTDIELLTNHLGIEGMMRFFQQTETGAGNYTEERKQWLVASDVRSLANEIIRQRHQKKQ